MSDMSDPSQAAAWVADWKGYYAKRHAGPLGLARRLRRAATEQRANYRATSRTGWKGSKGRAAYERSVCMLEREADKAEAQAKVWKAADDARKAQEALRAGERRAELMEKYPAR